MIRVDFRTKFSNGQHIYDYKVKVEKDAIFKEVVAAAMRKWLEKKCKKSGGDPSLISLSDVESVMSNIMSVECNGSDLTDEIDEQDATLEEMDSCRTPISKGFVVVVKWTPSIAEPAKKKYKYGAHDVLTKKVAVGMKYLEIATDPDVQQNLDGQIIHFLYKFYHETNMGYISTEQKKQLSTNAQKLKNVMCFLHKHWKLFVRADFPIIAQDSENDFTTSALLIGLSETKRRTSRKQESLHMVKVDEHLNTLTGLVWSYFDAAPYAQTALKEVRSEIEKLVRLLQRRKDYIMNRRKNAQQKDKQDADPRDVAAAFRDSLKTVKLSAKEYHTEVDHALSKKSKKKSGKPTAFTKCVQASIKKVHNTLRKSEDYEPIFLTDDTMSIDKYGSEQGYSVLPSGQRTRYRFKFRDELQKGADGICYHIFGRTVDGTNPDCLVVTTGKKNAMQERRENSKKQNQK